MTRSQGWWSGYRLCLGLWMLSDAFREIGYPDTNWWIAGFYLALAAIFAAAGVQGWRKARWADKRAARQFTIGTNRCIDMDIVMRRGSGKVTVTSESTASGQKVRGTWNEANRVYEDHRAEWAARDAGGDQ